VLEIAAHEWFQDTGYSQRRVKSRLTAFKKEEIHRRTFLKQLLAATVAVREELDRISQHVPRGGTGFKFVGKSLRKPWSRQLNSDVLSLLRIAPLALMQYRPVAPNLKPRVHSQS
jgi:hypothetical protein